MTYICPVCGYNQLDEPPSDYNICDCCGTEFGYHDATLTHSELRKRWIAAGAKWHSPDFSPPTGWDPLKQLLAAGYNYELRSQATDSGNVRQMSKGRAFESSKATAISWQFATRAGA